MTGLTIAEAAEWLGLTAHTLRYYERIGLLPQVARNEAGRRRFQEEDLQRVEFLRKLRSTGMPIRQVQEYARLSREGPTTEPDRRRLLEEHRDDVARQLAELHECLAAIDRKIAIYAGKDLP